METGVLYLVGTPIGNLDDMTFRAVAVLKEVDLIAAEDTRKSRILLQRFGVETPVTSFYSYNQVKKTPELLAQLRAGKSLALITDAGMPGISDPAYYLVTRALEKGLRVVPVPGPTAFVAALVASGLPTRRFVFEGFLPAKKGRQTLFRQLASEERTLVFYESPHRLERTLEAILEFWGDRRLVVARELTKLYEEFIRGRASEVLARVKEKKLKGEIVLIVEGAANRHEDQQLGKRNRNEKED
jgi:16S rRNA (cytidine1402-2'-O)-methyltransferase